MKPTTVVRGACVAAGLAAMAVAAWTAADQAVHVRPAAWLRWIGVGALVHDLVVAPAALAAAWLVGRVVPARLRAPVQAALLLAGALVVLALPQLVGDGRLPGNPSLLPRDPATGLVVGLAGVALACGGWAAARLVRARGRRA